MLAKIGTWLASVLAAVAGLFAAGLYVFRRGAKRQADADKAAMADQAQQDADAAGGVAQAAQQAASEVPEPKAPDTVKRDDFDTTD